jgi:hypothetical protein
MTIESLKTFAQMFERPAAPALAHQVRFYRDKKDFADAVAHFLDGGLEPAGACIVIATAAHQASIAARLEAMDINIAAAHRSRRYTLWDSERLLRMTTVSGQLNGWHFCEAVGSILARAQLESPWVHVFTDLGALLWAKRRWHDAECAEELLNRLSASYAVSVLSAYPSRFLRMPAHKALLDKLMRGHAAAVETGSSARQRPRRLAVSGAPQFLREAAGDGEREDHTASA